MLNTLPAEMPLRIIVQVKNDSTEIRLDEDYGFQMFMGLAKSAYNHNYEVAFELFEKSLRQQHG